MPRSVNSVASRKRRKKILKAAKGYFGRRKNVYTVANNLVEKAMSYAYSKRKDLQSCLVRLWCVSIYVGVGGSGITSCTNM